MTKKITMDDSYYNLNLKFVLLTDSHRQEAKESLDKVDGILDAEGNPIDAYRKTRYGFQKFFVTINSVEISLPELNDAWEKFSRGKTANFGVGTSGDELLLTYDQEFYRLDYLEQCMKDIHNFLQIIFDIDIEILAKESK